MLQYAQYDMAKFLLINPANRLFGEHCNLPADMRADMFYFLLIKNIDYKLHVGNFNSPQFRHDIRQRKFAKLKLVVFSWL